MYVGILEEIMYDDIWEVWLARFRLFHSWKIISYVCTAYPFPVSLYFFERFDKSVEELRTPSGQ